MKIRITKINYAIEEEDLDECESFEEFEDAKAEILARLPKTMLINIKDSIPEEDLEEYICNFVSDRTGWLNYGCEYEIL